MAEAFVAACSDGVLVRCPYGNGQPPTITFASDPPITIQYGTQSTRGLYLVASVRPDGDHWAIVQGQSDGTGAVLIKRRSRTCVKLGVAAGQDPVWVTPTVVAYVERSGDHWSRNGVSLPCARTSQGFAYFNQDEPVFRDSLHSIVLGGVLFSRPRLSGHWWVGQGSTPASVLAYDTRSQQVFTVWRGYTPVGPNITQQADGSAIVGVNPFNLFVGSAQFVPYAPPVEPPEPEPPGPSPVPTSCRFHPCGMDGWKSSTSECHFLDGTLKWGGLAYDARLVNEGQPWAKPYGGQLWSVWCSTERQPDEYPTHTAYVKESIALAKAQKRTLLVVSDDPEWTSKAQAIETAAKNAGVKSARGLEAYPFPGETTDESDDRMERLVRAAKTAKKQAVVISRADWAGCLALAPRIHKLVDQKFPSTIAGHLVFGTFRSDSPEAVDTMKWWEKTWALMPSGVILPL